MTTILQPDLFAAAAERDAALLTVEHNADPDWMRTATQAVLDLPIGEQFTTDAVWAALAGTDAITHEPRALGALMRRLARAGAIAKTGDYLPSGRRECHMRPVPVWVRLL